MQPCYSKHKHKHEHNNDDDNNNNSNEKVNIMVASVKCLYIVAFLAVVGITSFIPADAAGECPKSSPDAEAMKLLPCASAAQDPNAVPSGSCCSQVKQLGQNPKCLCAVMLSNTAKSAGVKPEVALTIPKRCNLADRPVGYKCGGQPLTYLCVSNTYFISSIHKILCIL